MADLPFKSANFEGDIPSPSTTSFTLTPKYPTDIWSKPGPPETSVFNAPLLYKPIPLSKFQRVRVTASADWKTLYDQGGLVFVLPSQKDDGSSGGGGGQKWIKSGIEFYSGSVYVSTVVKDRWADWSLVPAAAAGVRNGNEVTLEFERNRDEGTLWIYVVVVVAVGGGEKRIPLREVTWVLSEEEQEVWVGVYAATPTEGGGGLTVRFRDWELDTE